MEKKKYSIDELKNIVYHNPSNRAGGLNTIRAFLLLHKDRKISNGAQRNDFTLNKALLLDLGFKGANNAEIMVANYPEKKIQLIINPKGLDGPRKMVKMNPNASTGMNVAMGGLIETFMFQNGYEYTPEKNYFHVELEWEITFQEGNMIALEFSGIKDTFKHEHKD